jgi:hypothetical protein
VRFLGLRVPPVHLRSLVMAPVSVHTGACDSASLHVYVLVFVHPLSCQAHPSSSVWCHCPAVLHWVPATWPAIIPKDLAPGSCVS